MNICVVGGAGYVGLITGLGLAEKLGNNLLAHAFTRICSKVAIKSRLG